LRQIERTRDELQTALSDPALAVMRRYADVNRRGLVVAPIDLWRAGVMPRALAEATELFATR